MHACVKHYPHKSMSTHKKTHSFSHVCINTYHSPHPSNLHSTHYLDTILVSTSNQRKVCTHAHTHTLCVNIRSAKNLHTHTHTHTHTHRGKKTLRNNISATPNGKKSCNDLYIFSLITITCRRSEKKKKGGGGGGGGRKTKDMTIQTYRDNLSTHPNRLMASVGKVVTICWSTKTIHNILFHLLLIQYRQVCLLYKQDACHQSRDCLFVPFVA